MKFLTIIAGIIFFSVLIAPYIGGEAGAFPVFIIGFIVLTASVMAANHFKKKRMPGGIKGSVLQGIWVLEKNYRFDPALKKYESVPVEPRKNYFEFKDGNFRSGDFDEKHKQLPAEDSPFSVNGNNIIIESDYFKKADIKWAIKKRRLELTVEMANPKYSKSQFVFYKKNWA